jgi:8-oxo-dGTP pyrophosphatase MutT (NUDIX family)
VISIAAVKMNAIQNLKLTTIATQLSGHSPLIQEPGQRGHAAVAMLIKEGTSSPEVLFIIRAEHDRDPWSGNIGFPGGRLNDANEPPQQAAIRETFEELSVDLQAARYLGRLDDLFGATMPVLVSCFVYHVREPLTLNPNHEVAATFWTPLAKLLESDRHQRRNFYYRNKERNHPVVELLDPQQPPLWGITYRLMRSFFSVCAIDFGFAEAEEP